MLSFPTATEPHFFCKYAFTFGLKHNSLSHPINDIQMGIKFALCRAPIIWHLRETEHADHEHKNVCIMY